MDKETLSNYGWIVIVALVGMLMLILLSPLTDYVSDNINKNAMNEIKDVSIGENNTTDIKDSANRKKITFILNGGKINNGIIDGYLPGTSVPLPTDVSKENYEFGGWYRNASFTGNIETQVNSSANEDIIYYAKWIPQKFIISYNLNGGVFNSPNDVKYHYTYGKPFNLPTSTEYGKIAKTGYKFIGWYSTKDNKPFTYTTDLTKEITIYAKWESID